MNKETHDIYCDAHVLLLAKIAECNRWADRLAERDAALNLCMDAFERMGEMSAQGKLDSDVWYACVKARTALAALAPHAAPMKEPA